MSLEQQVRTHRDHDTKLWKPLTLPEIESTNPTQAIASTYSPHHG